MSYTHKEHIPGILIFIDFEKAFDSLEWKFLINCLEAFNFGSNFLRWVKLFYKKYKKVYYEQRYVFQLLCSRTRC